MICFICKYLYVGAFYYVVTKKLEIRFLMSCYAMNIGFKIAAVILTPKD